MYRNNLFDGIHTVSGHSVIMVIHAMQWLHVADSSVPTNFDVYTKITLYGSMVPNSSKLVLQIELQNSAKTLI